MVRSLILPLLGLALFATTEAALAQATPAAKVATKKEVRQTARATRRAGRTLTNREKKAAAAAALQDAATAAPVADAPSTWSGWSNDPLSSAADPITRRPTMNVSVAPGMPLNQVTSGVTTDYDGRPLRPSKATGSTLTIATPR